MANGKISFGVGFNVDKSSLNEIRTALQEIQRLTVQDITFNNKNTSVKEAQQQLIQVKSDAEDIEAALQRAFNPKIGSLNVSKFSNELNKLDIEKIYQNFSQLGSVGTRAFQQISSSVLQTNLQLKESHKVLDEMAKTMASTVRWGISSSIFNNLTGSIQKAWNYTKDLDTSLNEIRIVTDKSASDMERFAKQANKAAQSLGASTLDYTQASTIYYQQGLNDEEVAARAETTLKAANVTGQSGEAVSEQLTAIWNGYKVSAAEAELYIDKVAKVAAVTASDLNELSTGMSKVASAAASAGVDIDQLNATLATVISVTREAPETIGTAFRSIYARLGDLALDGEDEFGVSLGTVSGQLEELGIEILDEQGQMRDMGDIIEDTAAKWQTWTQAQRQAAAVAMAGKQQYSRLIALFDNWDMYEDALSASTGAMGTLNEQNEIYLESTEAHLQKLGTAWERVFDAMINNESTNQLIDIFTMATEGVANWIEAIGGGGNALLNLGTIATKVFSKQISSGINTVIENFKSAKYNTKQLADQLSGLKKAAEASGAKQLEDGTFAVGDDGRGDVGSITRYNERLKMQSYIGRLDESQIKEANEFIDYYANLKSEVQQIEQDRERAKQLIKEALINNTTDEDEVKKITDEYVEQALRDPDSEARSRVDITAAGVETDIQEYKSVLDEIKIAQQNLKAKDLGQDEQAEKFEHLKNVIEQTSDELNKLYNRKDLSKSSKDRIQKAIKEFQKIDISENTDIDEKFVDTAQKGFLTASTAMNKSIQELNQNTKTVSNALNNEASQALQKVKVDADSATASINNMHKGFERIDKIESFVRLTSGISGMVAAFSNFVSLWDVWNNEDLSTGEKLLQIVMGLTSAFGMLASSIQDIKQANAGQIFKNLTEQLGGKVLQTNAGQKIGQLFSKGMTKNVTEGTVAITKMGSAATKTGTALTSTGSAATSMGGAAASAGAVGIATLGAIAAAAVVAGLAIYGLVKAYNADVDAAKKAAEAAKEAQTIAEETKTAYDELKSGLEAYDTAVEKLKDLKEGTEEYKTALEEANRQVIDLVRNNEELSEYVKRDEKGLLYFEEGYEDVVDSARSRMNSTQAAADIAQVNANRANLKSERTNLIRDMGLDFWWSLEAPITGDWIDDAQLQDIVTAINENSGRLDESVLSQIDSIKGNQSLIDTLLETDNRTQLEDLAAETKSLNETNKLLIDESIRSGLEDYEDYAKMSDVEKNAVANLYKKGLTEEEQDRIRKEIHDELYQDWAFGWGNEDEIHRQYAEARGWTLVDDKWGDKAVYVNDEGDEEVVTDDSARAFLENEQVADKLADYNPERLKIILEGIKGISNATQGLDENLVAELLGFASKDRSFDESSMSYGMYTQLQNALTSGDLQSKLSGITSEQWKELDYENAQDYIDTLTKELKKIDSEDALKISKERLAGVSENAVNLQEGLQSGDITYENISENEDYKALSEQLNELKETYPEVEAAANVLGKTWLVGTEQYSEALEQVQDKLYDAKIDTLVDDANEKIDKLYKDIQNEDGTVEIEIDDEDFQNKIDEILDANYEIDIAIHTEAEDEFNDIISSMDDINKKASMIGENFVVSADDIRELNNTFPGIIQNMQDLGDGTVQLNEQVVQSAINMAQAEVAADSEATIKKLQNQASLLRQKQAVYQQMANAAAILAGAEVDADMTANEAKAAISDNLAKLKGLNDQIQTQTEMDNDKAAADASNENAEITAQNWASAYQSAAQSSYKFATTAVANMKAAAGQGKPVAAGDFGVSYQGSSGTSSEAKVIEGTQSALDSGDTTQDQWAKLAQQYQMLADSAGASANDIEGMIAQIGASNVEIGANLGNIRSGKGSKGSSKSAKDPDLIDYLEDEKDRYHDIDIILQQISTDLDILQKQQDKLFGQDLIDNLNEQLALLDDQIDATNEKISIANQEVSELRSNLANRGVTFNADGTIANYASAYQAQLAYVNSLIAQYNSMSAEAQEGFKDTVEKAQEDFETFVSNIERYDELITDTIPGLEAEIQDAINEQIEIQIEQFNMEIEIRLNLAEAERDWNEFKKRIIDGIDDEDILGNASARLQDFYSYYKDDENGIIQANTRHVEDILQQLYQMDNTGWSDVYGDNRNQALEDLQTYYEQLISDMNDLQDLQEEIHEAYLDMMDEAQDKFDEQIETYETISDLIEHDMNVISLVSGDESYTELAKYYEMQEDNYNKQLDFQRQQVDFWEQQMNTLEKGSDEWESAKEKWIDAVSEWNSMVEEAIENLQDKYLNAINKIFQDLNNQVTNGLGLDYVEEEWNLINENADQYLDTVNSLYEVQKLENKYLDALDETDSISARRELKEIMDEELEDLREKDKLTQYDIERANMRYEIALKQIALEEAQQNKTTMRLRRDSQGNYSYQYVADDDAVADAQDELNDLYNSLYNFDKENYQENLNQLYEIWAEFQEKMAEAAQINDPNARAERELLLQEQYGELINGLVEQNETIRSNLRDSTFEDLARLYEIDVSNFQNMSDEEQEILMSDLIPYWDSGVQHMADVFAGEGGFLGVCQEAFEQLHDATKDYEDGLTDLETTAGISFDNINDGIDDAIFKTEDLLNKNDELINAYQEEMDAIASVISQLDALIAKYTAAKNEAIAATEAAYKYWVQEQQRAANAAAGNSSGGGAGGSGSSSGSGSGYGGGGSGSSRSGDGNLTVGDVATYSGSYYYDSYGTAPSGRRYSGVAGGIVVDKINNNPYGVHIHSSDGKFKDLGWVKKSQLTGYESGGYTGDWAGESGRLALLHQKELVLNANDTSNILNAVQILRDITDTIGSSILSKMSAITANTSIGGNLGETFEQNVHIDANFPNVTNSKEIESAIDNLMNVATQRANRR